MCCTTTARADDLAMRFEQWTDNEIVCRIREAGDTVRRLPRPRGPAGYSSGWPDVVRDVRDAYGYTPSQIRPAAPTPRAIDRMDEVFTWFRFLEGRVDECRAMWLCVGCGMSFSQVGRVLGVSRTTIRTRVWGAVRLVSAGLNKINRNPP